MMQRGPGLVCWPGGRLILAGPDFPSRLTRMAGAHLSSLGIASNLNAVMISAPPPHLPAPAPSITLTPMLTLTSFTHGQCP